MAYVKIENGIVIYKTYEVDETLVNVSDSVCCGMIQKADGTFSNPPVSSVTLLDMLRDKRNNLLTQTDWRMTTDYPYNDQAAWASYRTSLRNLPATSEPTLDEQGNLIVDWPTAPSEV